MVFPHLIIHEYANAIIFIYIAMDLSDCTTDNIKTCNDGGFMMVLGLKSVHVLLFIIMIIFTSF